MDGIARCALSVLWMATRSNSVGIAEREQPSAISRKGSAKAGTPFGLPISIYESMIV